MTQQVSPRNKVKKNSNSRSDWMGGTGLIVIEFLPNLRDFPAGRMDPKRVTYHVSKVSQVYLDNKPAHIF